MVPRPVKSSILCSHLADGRYRVHVGVSALTSCWRPRGLKILSSSSAEMAARWRPPGACRAASLPPLAPLHCTGQRLSGRRAGLAPQHGPARSGSEDQRASGPTGVRGRGQPHLYESQDISIDRWQWPLTAGQRQQARSVLSLAAGVWKTADTCGR